MIFDYNKVEELYPGAGNLMIQPMLIHKGTDKQLKACDDGEWFAELKKDGALYMFVKGDEESQNYLFGRTVSKKTGLLTEKAANVPHITTTLGTLLPPQTVLLGEIYYPGGTSKNVTSIMGCLPAKAIERQEGEYGFIHYFLYDCLVYNGTNLISYNNYDRYKVIEAIYNKHIKRMLHDYVELANIYEENLYEEVGKALAAGEEGMVFKKKNGLYEPGKRPQTMLKAKQVDYIDAVIIGFKEPTMEYTGKEIENWQYWVDEFGNPLPVGLHYGNPCAEAVTKHFYYGWINAIEIGAYDENGKIHSIGTIASGLTDFYREDMAANPDKYLGKVVEIQCMMKDNKEQTLRHGFFLRIRDDKNKEECKLKEIFK